MSSQKYKLFQLTFIFAFYFLTISEVKYIGYICLHGIHRVKHVFVEWSVGNKFLILTMSN